MLDIKFIREHQKEVEKITKDKNIKLDLEHLLKLDDERKTILGEIETLRAERNQIGGGKDNIEKARFIKKALSDLEPKLNEISEEILELSLHVPNIISADTPIGDETKNKVVSKHGKIKDFSFEPKNHVELGKNLDIFDLERGAKVSGFRGYFLKREGAVLHFALMQFALAKMIKNGFIPFITPTLVNRMSLVGSGHFPFGKDEIYQIANPGKLCSGDDVSEPMYLAGTAEPALLAYYANEIINEKDLPIKFCGFSPCYRSEIGSYGKDTKGLFRVHEFMKIEQMVICQDNIAESNKWLETLRKNSEEILEDLELPYRVVQIASGDMGAGKYKMYDIETWIPSQKSYRETHSDSNLTDWQTRRLNIRYKDKTGKKHYPYALNNTALATPRILIAILENHQQKDGSILIPKALQKYCGFSKITR